MSVFVGDQADDNRPKRKHKKKYPTKYSTKYTEDYPWALPSSKGNIFAFCHLCNVDICIRSVGAKGLRDHEATCRHSQSTQQYKISQEEKKKSSTSPKKTISINAINSFSLSAPLEDHYENAQVSTTAITTPGNFVSSPAISASEMLHSMENTTIFSNDSPCYYYAPPISSRYSNSSYSQETTNHHGLSINESSQTPPPVIVSTNNCNSVQLPGSVYTMLEAAAEGRIENSHDRSSISNFTPTNTGLYANSSGKVTISTTGPIAIDISNHPIGGCRKEILKCNPKNEFDTLDEDLDDISTNRPDTVDVSIDDLTCNICGTVFANWKDLKNDLLNHVKTAQKDSKSKRTASNKKQKKSAQKPSTVSCRRGRPLGSKNKTSCVSQVDESSSNASSPSNPEVRKPGNDDQEKLVRRSGRSSRAASRRQFKNNKDGFVEAEADVSIIAMPIQQISDSFTGSRPIVPVKRNGQLHCRVCKASFYSREELKSHFQDKHNKGRPYECQYCQKFFTTKNHLEVHRKHKHLNGPNPCKCATCGKVLSSRTNLKIHLRIHKGEKPFECPICKKQFSRKANMEMHTVYHTGERKYTCEVCGQSFFAINALKRHTKLHTGERDYACDVCGSTYVTGTDLRRHRLKHDDVKPFPCHLCEKQFTRSHDLKIHLRYHNKDLRFTCKVCSKQFVESGNYRRHMRRHTGERPYVCNICLQTFSQVHHYKVHMQTNHSEENETVNFKLRGKKQELPVLVNQKITKLKRNTTKNVKNVTVNEMSNAGQNRMHCGGAIHNHYHSHSSVPNAGAIISVTNLGGGIPSGHNSVPVTAPHNSTQVHPTSNNQGPTWSLQYNSFLCNSSGIPQYPIIDNNCHQPSTATHLPHH